MKKKSFILGILTIVLLGIFVPTNFVYADWYNPFSWGFGDVVDGLFKGIALLLMGISSLVLMVSGWVFDGVVKYTIIDMGKNLGDPKGIGGGITAAWETLRDIANMCFIFVLLYAAFKAMFEANFGNYGKIVKDIIIIALLINFSLFLSKVVIDASNVVALGFYKSIISTSVLQSASASGSYSGISAGYMNMLGLQTFFSAEFLKADISVNSVMTMGILSSAFMLISAVIFLIAGVIFAARFVILIFLMILSPLALIAYAIPGMNGRFVEWRKALFDQSFFAPMYFALTWVVFKLGTKLIGSLNPSGQQQLWTDITTNPKGIMPLILNYILITGFAIAALIFSKKMASSTFGFKQISGSIGSVAIGGTAWAGRRSVGWAGQKVAGNEWLRSKAPDSKIARMTLQAGQKAGSASFDARASKMLGAIPGLGGEMKGFGKAGGKGGFQASREATIKKRMEFMEKNIEAKVTGANVEKEMRKLYPGGAYEQLMKDPNAAEAARLKIQEDLQKQAGEETERRKTKYLHDLSQTRFGEITYGGVYENTEAARRMRKGEKSKSKKDELMDKLKEFMDESKPSEEGGGGKTAPPS